MDSEFFFKFDARNVYAATHYTVNFIATARMYYRAKAREYCIKLIFVIILNISDSTAIFI